MIEDAASWMLSTDAWRGADGRIGLVGISFGGGLSIVAAGRASIRGHLAFVMAFGGHADLPRTLRFLCTGVQPDGTKRAPHDYGLAIVLLGAAGAMAARWPRARIAALSAVLVWSFALRTDTYLVWQAQAVKDEAIRQKIAALPEARKYQVIAVHDRYDIVDPSWYGNDLVLWWSYALKMVFGDFTRFGIYEHDEKRALSLQRYVAADIDRLLLRDRVHPPAFDAAAPQVSVIVDPGPRASRRRLALDYYVARLRGEAAVRDLLGGVVSVRVIERR